MPSYPLLRRTVMCATLVVIFFFASDRVSTPSASASVHSTTVPTLATSCPAIGTARAAVMPPLSLGHDQTLVYIYNEVPPSTSTSFGHLKSYDVLTHHKNVIVTSGPQIDNAQVSLDGQWILFVVPPDPRDSAGQEMLQLVRVDGVDLQTLYCSAPHSRITNIQWLSKFLVFDTTDDTAGVSTVTLLTLATGSLRQELRAPSTDAYTTVTWLDSKRLYILHPAPTAPLETLSLLDITTGRLTKVKDLLLLDTSWSLDSSFNARTLFLGDCEQPESGPRGHDSTITSEPATGGTTQQLYHDTAGCLQTLRAVTPSTLLFTDVIPGGDFGHKEVWRIQTDGTGLTRLYDNGGTHTLDVLNRYTQFPWSNVSRDASLYAFEEHGVTSCQDNLLIGPLSGGSPQVFAFTCRGSVAIVGWTTM